MIIQGDCLEVLKTLPDNSIDSIVTDPPYELGFMGKSWDSTGIANNVEMWSECLRVLKPGGHLLAFSGTRTYHRMASAIEDAGFEVRDMIEWVYGSGFPKSLNIGKSVDKLQGNEREVVGDRLTPDGKKWSERRPNGIKSQFKEFNKSKEESDKQCIDTKGTSEWEGWGTALKPSHESIMVAQKPLDSSSDIKYNIGIISKNILLCLSQLFAKTAENNSKLNPKELKEVADIAQWLADKNINTQEDLQEAMDMLRSSIMEGMNLSIVLLWLNTLAGIWKNESIFTTKTETNLITELKILKSLEWESILQNIIEQKSNKTDGLSADAYNAGILLNAVRLKLNYIQEHFAQDTATDLVKNKVSRPKHEPICMARKPLEAKSVAENCLKWGTGGINIDESRVGTEGGETHKGGFQKQYVGDKVDYENHGVDTDLTPKGRFPANLIHDNSEEVRECFPNSKAGSYKGEGSKSGGIWSESTGKPAGVEYGDNGSASRFFKSIIYQAKASGTERNQGLDKLVLVDIMEVLNNNTTLCEKSLIKEVKLAQLLVGMEQSGFTVTAVSGTQNKSVTEWSIGFFGKDTTEKYQEDYKSIILTETHSIMPLKIYKWLIHLLTNGYIQDVSLETATGGNLVGSAENYSELTITISEKMALALGVKNAQSPTQLKISVKEGKSGHPTVKPIALMEYLIKMVTPKGGTVLDPFAGSGSTLVAAKKNGFNYIGIELTAEYIPIIEARLSAVKLDQTLNN